MTTIGASVVQQVPWGGNVSLSLQNYKSDTNQAFQLINPRYGSTLRFDFTQPLLKNFGSKVARRQIIVARNNLDISQSQLRTTLIATVYQVQEAYWNLVYAIESLNVKRQSLQLARDLLAKNKKEVDVGTLAPLEVLNAEATVAQREADILQAEALIRKCEDILKTLINPVPEGEIRSLKIEPADKPAFKPISISLDEALKEAMDRRPDLEVNKTTILTNQINFSVAKNQLLPQLDLNLSYWSPGISGDRILYLNNDPFLGVIIGKEKGRGLQRVSRRHEIPLPELDGGADPVGPRQQHRGPGQLRPGQAPARPKPGQAEEPGTADLSRSERRRPERGDGR